MKTNIIIIIKIAVIIQFIKSVLILSTGFSERFLILRILRDAIITTHKSSIRVHVIIVTFYSRIFSTGF
jgi:hypothetical protein